MISSVQGHGTRLKVDLPIKGEDRSSS